MTLQEHGAHIYNSTDSCLQHQKHCTATIQMDLVISRICFTIIFMLPYTFRDGYSSSRFTVEAMITISYHEYKGESMQLLKDCEEQLQLLCKWKHVFFISG